MRLSKLPLTTFKEVPAEAEIASHQLMLRAGLIRQLASGLFTWMPIGLRVLRKVEAIVRAEMNRAGAFELLMPAVQPAELWKESERWEETVAAASIPGWSDVLTPRHLGAVLYLVTMYGMWNLWAGYNGFFTPYLIEQNHLPEWAATVVPAGYFGIGMVSIFFIFMKLSDTVDQRLLFGISAAMHVFGMALLAVFGFTLEIVIIHILIMGIAGGFGAQSFFQLWSSELFPTEIRSTAQGVCFAVVRIGLGIWSLAVTSLASTNFTTLAWILTGFLAVSGLIGYLWAPNNAGKSLEQLEAERQSC